MNSVRRWAAHPKATRTYMVNQAAADWLANGLGQSDRTRKLYGSGPAPGKLGAPILGRQPGSYW
jgi:hypothetical protein